jgi:hypothetical protein
LAYHLVNLTSAALSTPTRPFAKTSTKLSTRLNTNNTSNQNSSSVNNKTSNSENITWTEFENAVVLSGYPKPKKQQYEAFVAKIKKDGGIDSKREAGIYMSLS